MAQVSSFLLSVGHRAPDSLMKALLQILCQLFKKTKNTLQNNKLKQKTDKFRLTKPKNKRFLAECSIPTGGIPPIGKRNRRHAD